MKNGGYHRQVGLLSDQQVYGVRGGMSVWILTNGDQTLDNPLGVGEHCILDSLIVFSVFESGEKQIDFHGIGGGGSHGMVGSHPRPFLRQHWNHLQHHTVRSMGHTAGRKVVGGVKYSPLRATF